MSVAVISSTGILLMPTSEYKARKLLKKGRAVIYKHSPMFTIRLTDRENGETQNIEYSSDVGYQHVGISLKSEKHEYVHAQYDMLKDEKKRHDDCRRYRRGRRNGKRYRKPRFDNRSKKNKDMVPSVRHREENQIRLFESFCEIVPITSACFEVGKFDTQLMQAIEAGKPLPKGKDYQQGAKYLYQTERTAVFGRDHYTCQVCGKSVSDGAILRTHHIGYWKHDHSNRIGNLLTVCTKCHTSANHKKTGKLWGLEPKSNNLAPAAYMNTVRWDMVNKLKEAHPDIDIHVQYGAKTAVTRRERHIAKTHANDAYCIGKFRPKHRCRETHYIKKRRNNRVLSKFYDAKYIDIRDGKKKSGSELSCGRTNRSENRRSEKNNRIYRGKKVSKGRTSTREQHYPYQPGDIVLYRGCKQRVKGTHCKGTRVLLETGRSVKTADLHSIRKIGGWQFLPALKDGVSLPKL